MPVKIFKKSVEYCIANKPFFAFLLVLLFICNYLIDLTNQTLIIPIIITVLMWGYGLQVTENIINGGTTLPKILPKKVLKYGVKGYFVSLFYYGIQLGLLAIFAVILNFPLFELENLILNFYDTIHLLLQHDWLSCIIFLVSGFLIVYVTSFFMELAVARLADGGKFKNAFKFSRIKRSIDIIGWRRYTVNYTKIIISICILLFLINHNLPNEILDTIFDTILYFLIFIIEFIGMGHVYKIYMDNKSKIQDSN